MIETICVNPIEQKILQQIQNRITSHPHLGLKINLYKFYEVEALSIAMRDLGMLNASSPVECVMIGDSYFMTHLGKESTQLNTLEEQRWGLDTIISLIQEVRTALNNFFEKKHRPYLVGDMPDGSVKDIITAINAAERMVTAGADIIKFEITSSNSYSILEKLNNSGFKVMAHIGYTPQKNQLKRYGDSIQSAMAVFEMARKLKDIGATSIVIEMVSEAVNRALCGNIKTGLPIYSVFSGYAQYGGQSLNVWDSVIKPAFSSRYFPPTAEFSRSDYPSKYTVNIISSKLKDLISLTLSKKFPLKPATLLSLEDENKIISINPWKENIIDKIPSKKTIFDKYESEARVYCRKFPAIFVKAQNHLVWDDTGQEYIDFLSGAGVLNYGHNNKAIKKEITDYINQDGIIHSLDLHTKAKREFIENFVESILKPRNLEYKLQFTGPTGSNAVEAALKIARKVTKKQTIISFTNGFHGMSLGALSTTGSIYKRAGAGVPLTYTVRMPYEGYPGIQNSLVYIESLLDDPSSGIDLPAAMIVETIQAEGGVITASIEWLKKLYDLCARKKILLIIDDIQAGCGRTGDFFSFEQAGIYPDIVCLSKAIGGYGLPLSIVLLKPSLDIQKPGEHSGTFRGNNLAFVAAKAAISLWNDSSFIRCIKNNIYLLDKWLNELNDYANDKIMISGRGLLRGVAFKKHSLAQEISHNSYNNGLLIETSGAHNHVIKIMPPLTIPKAEMQRGLDILLNEITKAVK